MSSPAATAAPPLETAFAYAELGWHVVPLCAPRHGCDGAGKFPWDPVAEVHPREWQRRLPTTDPATIDRWLSSRTGPRCNLGILTGARSGIVAIDVDGPLGEVLLRERAGGDLLETVEFVTGRGRRLVYALPPGAALASRREQPTGLGLDGGLELLAEGRQMVAPPSLHPSGRVYAWAPGRSPWQIDPAPAPGWVVSWGRPTGDGAPGLDAAELLKMVTTDVGPGSRHPTLLALAGHLLARGVDPAVTLEILRCINAVRCRPPKPDAELVAIVRDLTRAEADRHPARRAAHALVSWAEQAGIDPGLAERLARAIRRAGGGRRG